MVAWASDISDAFTTIIRDAVIAECQAASVTLGAVAKAWLGSSSTHVIVADGASELVGQHVGLDQGCPLSPGLYSVATRRARQRAQTAAAEAASIP